MLAVERYYAEPPLLREVAAMPLMQAHWTTVH
jgi:hypothetical protein